MPGRHPFTNGCFVVSHLLPSIDKRFALQSSSISKHTWNFVSSSCLQCRRPVLRICAWSWSTESTSLACSDGNTRSCFNPLSVSMAQVGYLMPIICKLFYADTLREFSSWRQDRSQGGCNLWISHPGSDIFRIRLISVMTIAGRLHIKGIFGCCTCMGAWFL